MRHRVRWWEWVIGIGMIVYMAASVVGIAVLVFRYVCAVLWEM